MRHPYVSLIAAFLLVAALAACGGKTPEPATPESPRENAASLSLAPSSPPPASTAPPAPPASIPPPALPAAQALASTPPISPAPSAPALDPKHRKLIGTHWQVSDFSLHFTGEKTVELKGGPLVAFYPNGVEAHYTYHDGAIEVNIMGHAKAGSWDGENLTVSGVAGKRKAG